MIRRSCVKLVFEDEVLKITIDLDLALLRLTWLQHPNREDYRRGYRQAINLAFEYNVKLWLTDSRQVHYLPVADQHWMYAQMCPLLEAGKLSRFAIVMQPETYIATDKAPISDSTEPPFRIKKTVNLDLFLDLASSQAWLLEEVKC